MERLTMHVLETAGGRRAAGLEIEQWLRAEFWRDAHGSRFRAGGRPGRQGSELGSAKLSCASAFAAFASTHRGS